MLKWQQYRLSEAELHKGVGSKRLFFSCVGRIYMSSQGKAVALKCGGCFTKISDK